MPTPRDEHKRAEALELKEKRARDAALAMSQYEEKKQAALAKTARLRALRLEQEAANDRSKAAQDSAEPGSTARIKEIHARMQQTRKVPAKAAPARKTLKRA